jgi:DNA-binding CsgD family transcriptional regulator
MGYTIPWARINGFLLDVGKAMDAVDFHHRVLGGMQDLIPFDCPGMCLRHCGRGHEVTALAGDPARVRVFNDRYRFLIPFDRNFTLQSWVTDFRCYESSEFVADWIRPAGIRQALLNKTPGYVVCLARSRTGPVFTEREVAIHRVVTAHLNNLFAVYDRMAARGRPAITVAELAPECSLLSRRESEVVALMVQRLSAREIGARLLISPRTVERHVATVYNKLNVNGRRELLERMCLCDFAAAS